MGGGGGAVNKFQGTTYDVCISHNDFLKKENQKTPIFSEKIFSYKICTLAE